MHKKIMWGFALLAACCLAGACVRTSSASRPAASACADYCGAYEGILPAADGPGICTELVLHKNGEFTLKEEYIERDYSVSDQGRFTLREDVVSARTPDGRYFYYRLDGDTARLLDAEKKAVSGPLASYYVLKRV